MRFNFSLTNKRRTDLDYMAFTNRTPNVQWELYLALMSLSLNGPLYMQREDRLSPIRKLIRENDPEFLTELALWLREKAGLRKLAFLLTVELAVLYPNKEWVGRLTGLVIQKAGDIPAWLDYYVRIHGKGDGKALPRPDRQVRRSLAMLLNELNEYQFVRYSRDMQLKLKYALSLVHPKAKDKVQKALFEKVLADQLPTRNNWEAELDALQRQHYDSIALKQLTIRDKWKELISSFRIGYPALLKNIQAILDAGVSGKVLKLTAEYLGNEAAVVKNRQLPFHLLERYRGLKVRGHGGAGMLLDALENAAMHSARNLDGFAEDTRVVIAMDVSNSMKQPLQSATGLLQGFDIGPLLAMSLQYRCRQVITGIVGNTWKTIELPKKQILAGVDQFHSREGEAGYATNGHLVIEDLLKKGIVADKILLFTDCQLWNSRPFNQPEADLRKLWGQYKQLAPQARIYLFDLLGHGRVRLDMPEDDVYLINGWNDRVFTTLKAMESVQEVIAD